MNWNFDQDLIGSIQFDHKLTQQQQTRLIQLIENEEKIKMTGISIKHPLNQKQKNRLISLIEAEEERQTEIELNGSKRNVNGYFQ